MQMDVLHGDNLPPQDITNFIGRRDSLDSIIEEEMSRDMPVDDGLNPGLEIPVLLVQEKQNSDDYQADVNLSVIN